MKQILKPMSMSFFNKKVLEGIKNIMAKFSKGAILKTATMGYDGKGQFVIDKNSDLASIWKEASDKGQLILEEFVDFDQEISVMIARNKIDN